MSTRRMIVKSLKDHVLVNAQLRVQPSLQHSEQLPLLIVVVVTKVGTILLASIK